MEHTPSYKDWVDFHDWTADYLLFHIDGTGLTIRAQECDSCNYGYAAGLLASVDPQGNGFSHSYGFSSLDFFLSQLQYSKLKVQDTLR